MKKFSEYRNGLLEGASFVLFLSLFGELLMAGHHIHTIEQSVIIMIGSILLVMAYLAVSKFIKKPVRYFFQVILAGAYGEVILFCYGVHTLLKTLLIFSSDLIICMLAIGIFYLRHHK